MTADVTEIARHGIYVIFYKTLNAANIGNYRTAFKARVVYKINRCLRRQRNENNVVPRKAVRLRVYNSVFNGIASRLRRTVPTVDGVTGSFKG